MKELLAGFAAAEVDYAAVEDSDEIVMEQACPIHA
jgi:hypothetical protein